MPCILGSASARIGQTLSNLGCVAGKPPFYLDLLKHVQQMLHKCSRAALRTSHKNARKMPPLRRTGCGKGKEAGKMLEKRSTNAHESICSTISRRRPHQIRVLARFRQNWPAIGQHLTWMSFEADARKLLNKCSCEHFAGNPPTPFPWHIRRRGIMRAFVEPVFAMSGARRGSILFNLCWTLFSGLRHGGLEWFSAAQYSARISAPRATVGHARWL